MLVHFTFFNIPVIYSNSEQTWQRGVVVSVVRVSYERSYATSGPVSTGMGDHLWAGIPSRYVTSQLGQLGLASLRDR